MKIGQRYKIVIRSGVIKYGYYCQNISTHPDILYLRTYRFNIHFTRHSYYTDYILVYVPEVIEIEELT